MLVLKVMTVQSAAIRILVEALKEILTDANIEFTSEGMKVVKMDSSHTVLVHLKLNAENFEYYECVRPLTIGINMINFFKLIRTIGNDDTLTLFIEDDKMGVLGIRIENGDKNSVTNYKLHLMEIDEESISIPVARFESVITLPSIDFQKIVKDMSNLSDAIEIKSYGSKLIFSCTGDLAQQETIIGEAQFGISFTEKSEGIVQGIFSAKHLVSFTKCTNLCNSIEMYLKNDYPLIIKYTCASLGSLKLKQDFYS